MVKKLACILLAVCLLINGNIAGKVFASEKASISRAIAIVFDNSGSMYDSGDQAWCRATYAMEVFASMLNEGDTLLIYPMHPITVGNTEYTMEKPFIVTDSSEAPLIRDIYTKKALGTPIESIDFAIQGLENAKADKKYMIVLTDGDLFYMNGGQMGTGETKRQLGSRFENMIEKGNTVMYLGIGNQTVMPDIEQSEFFIKNQASNSENVLSALTDMCNQIFGRDTLPKKLLSGETVNFDISMKKLIVFVQGENVSDLKLTSDSGNVGQLLGSAVTKYGTAGCGNYKSNPDTSLQGMMVTYSDCSAGSYNIEYSGNATSIEVYYEPDADLDFVFTDDMGNDVDPNALYEGTYKVSFGMKDAKTGELISSELLGEPVYEGSYSVNGEPFSITHKGYSGSVPVVLNMGDTFEAELTVTYLSGYTIRKDSSDFGWPNGGIKVAARPAGNLVLEITGGEELYSLQKLEESEPYTAKIYYQGKQLTGNDLKNVELKWDPDTSNAEIKKDFAEDHYKLYLLYKEGIAPEETVCGPCTVTIYAFYTEKGSDEAQCQTALTYNINDDYSPIRMDLFVPDNYFVISKLEESEPIIVNLTMNNQKLDPEEFDAVDLKVDFGGTDCEVTPDKENSSYKIKLLPAESAAEGKYDMTVTAAYTDNIGRTTETDDSVRLTLSDTPLWVKWALRLFLLLLLIIIILIILHIRLFPRNVHVNKRDSVMIFDGEDETKSTTFNAEMKKGRMAVGSKYAGTKTGLAMDVTRGKNSYLKNKNIRRSADVVSASVRKTGNATIQEATIGSVKYVLNEDTGKLERVPKNDKPFQLKHGTQISYSGTMLNAGVPKPFTVTTKLNFKKK